MSSGLGWVSMSHGLGWVSMSQGGRNNECHVYTGVVEVAVLTYCEYEG